MSDAFVWTKPDGTMVSFPRTPDGVRVLFHKNPLKLHATHRIMAALLAFPDGEGEFYASPQQVKEATKGDGLEVRNPTTYISQSSPNPDQRLQARIVDGIEIIHASGSFRMRFHGSIHPAEHVPPPMPELPTAPLTAAFLGFVCLYGKEAAVELARALGGDRSLLLKETERWFQENHFDELLVSGEWSRIQQAFKEFYSSDPKAKDLKNFTSAANAHLDALAVRLAKIADADRDRAVLHLTLGSELLRRLELRREHALYLLHLLRLIERGDSGGFSSSLRVSAAERLWAEAEFLYAVKLVPFILGDVETDRRFQAIRDSVARSNSQLKDMRAPLTEEQLNRARLVGRYLEVRAYSMLAKMNFGELSGPRQFVRDKLLKEAAVYCNTLVKLANDHPAEDPKRLRLLGFAAYAMDALRYDVQILAAHWPSNASLAQYRVTVSRILNLLEARHLSMNLFQGMHASCTLDEKALAYVHDEHGYNRLLERFYLITCGLLKVGASKEDPFAHAQDLLKTIGGQLDSSEMDVTEMRACKALMTQFCEVASSLLQEIDRRVNLKDEAHSLLKDMTAYVKKHSKQNVVYFYGLLLKRLLQTEMNPGTVP